MNMPYVLRSFAAVGSMMMLTSCDYVGMLRPSVLEELNPRVVALVNELPNVDHPNDHLITKIYALGGLSRAKEGPDGLMHANIRVPKDQYIWEPAFIVMPHPGKLDIEFDNQDQAIHIALMFMTGPDGYVWALDAATGALLWQYQHAIPLDVPLCCGNVNCGVAVADGKVFFATVSGHLVALDAMTGKPIWDKIFADVRSGESATMAPLIVKDKVLVGSSGGEYGVRGHLDAFEMATGRHSWRRYSVPKPGEPGADTWVGDSWARGGGTTWITGSYDPDLNLVFWGTGNPGPDFDGSGRAGDNLYTDSVLAIRPEDGSLVWHYQWTPHDVWDYDGVNENILFDQNGYLFILDRTNGRFISATPFARTSWGSIDQRSGRVQVQQMPTASGVEICPGPAGAKEWPHAAYSPKTHLLYTPVVELCGIFKSAPAEFRESLAYWGGEVENRRLQQWGAVKAFDAVTGQERWSQRTEHPVLGSLLTTAGNLVFVGEATGEFKALDAQTGTTLWQFQTGSGIHGSPVSYSVAGQQYIAVPSGWGGWLKGFAPHLYGAPRGAALYVFRLHGSVPISGNLLGSYAGPVSLR